MTIMTQNEKPQRVWESRGRRYWYWLLLTAVVANVAVAVADVTVWDPPFALLNGACAMFTLWAARDWRSTFSRCPR